MGPRFNFSMALEEIRKGNKVAREGWNGKGMYVSFHLGETQDDLPYLCMRTVQGKFVPWLASQTDLLAEDWFIVENPS